LFSADDIAGHYAIDLFSLAIITLIAADTLQIITPLHCHFITLTLLFHFRMLDY
jgi:hypothetical protein